MTVERRKRLTASSGRKKEQREFSWGTLALLKGMSHLAHILSINPLDFLPPLLDTPYPLLGLRSLPLPLLSLPLLPPLLQHQSIHLLPLDLLPPLLFLIF